jgi:CHAT domain-containing protein
VTARSALAAFVVLLAPAAARADNPFSADDLTLVLAERVDKHRAAAAAATAAGDPERAAYELVNLCANHVYVQYDPTTPECTAAFAAAEAYPEAKARLLGQMSCFTGWTLDWAKARELAAQALAIGKADPNTLAGEGLRLPHWCLGAIALEEGKWDEADRELALLLEQSLAAGDRGFTAGARAWRCRLATLTGNRDLGDAECAAVIELVEATDDHMNRSNAYWMAGQYALSLDRLDEAAALWERGLAYAIADRTPFGIATLRGVLGDLLSDLGRFAEARELLAAHQAEIDAGRLPASYRHQAAAATGSLHAAEGNHHRALELFLVAAESPLYITNLYALKMMAGSQYALGDLPAAQASLEKAVALIEAGRARAPGEDQRRTFMDRHAEVYRGLAGLIILRGEADAAARALAVAEAGRSRALLDAVRAAGVDAASMPPPPVAEIQASIGAGRVLVEYVAHADQLFALRVTRDAVTAFALPAGTRDELGARIAYYRDLIAQVDDPAELEAAGRALYRDVLAPVLAGVESDELVISPDGPLHALPFDALRVDGAFLVETYDVAITPSGSLLRASPARTSAARVLAVAAPELPPGRAPLPASAEEVRALSRTVSPPPIVLAGGAATETELRAAEPATYRVLHFATHATIDETLPLRSALELGASPTDDGRLRADEIYALRLDADLVVLSACRSGGGAITSSEGPMSLARAFLHAGASGVVATLWDVEDRHGPAFMRALYGRLAAQRSSAAAMGDAKRELIKRKAPPRAWAAYVMIGAPDVAPGLHAAVAGSTGGGPPVRTLFAGALALAGAALVVLGVALRLGSPRSPRSA